MNFADRDVLQKVRPAKDLVIGNSDREPHCHRMRSSLTQIPIVRDGTFRVHVRPRHHAEERWPRRQARQEGTSGIGVAVVDRSGRAIGGDAQAMRRLPSAGPSCSSIDRKRRWDPPTSARTRSFYEFEIRPVGGNALFAVASAPVVDGPLAFAGDWAAFFLVVLAAIVVLLVIWFGADRWCVRPLRYIQDFADKVARGETMTAGAAASLVTGNGLDRRRRDGDGRSDRQPRGDAARQRRAARPHAS